LHRPANVDGSEKLKELMHEITSNVNDLPIIFPMHPRTAKVYKEIGITANNLFIVDPLGYHEFNYLVERAMGVVTDSGGITEETTVMGVPCITLRDNTERPETIEIGTNELIGTNPKAVKPYLDKLVSKNWKLGGIPEKWDGKAAERIVDILLDLN
jgi:UDP-N-acetylglucosamine 2-epimerase (non-hydrolysing)